MRQAALCDSHAKSKENKVMVLLSISLSGNVSDYSVRGARGPNQPQLLLRDHLVHLRRQVFQLRSLHDFARLPLRQGLGSPHGDEAHRNIHRKLLDYIHSSRGLIESPPFSRFTSICARNCARSTRTTAFSTSSSAVGTETILPS